MPTLPSDLSGSLLVCALGLATAAGAAGEVPADLQRLQRERTQQQLELQLRMQQQQDRAARAPASASSEIQRRKLELDQQQRQQQRLEEESRGTLGRAEDALGQSPPNLVNERAGNAAAEQLQRFELERRVDSERDRASPSAPAPGISGRPF